MKLLKHICLLTVALLLLACEKEVTSIKLPGASSQLVLNSFISPQDSLLDVYVHESKPLVGTRPGSVYDPITDATVILSDGEKSVTLPLVARFTNGMRDVYRVRAEAFPIAAGRTYFLQVSTPDGRRANARCTVPVVRTTPEFLLDSTIITEQGREYTRYRGRLRWQDPVGETNFYRVDGESYDVLPIGGDEVIEYRNRLNWEINKTTFFSDSKLDGAVFTSSVATKEVFRFLRSSTVYVYLLTTDQGYFEYHRTLRANNVDNPFAEPVLSYTNVENGLGVFSAYNRTTLEIKLK